MVLQFEKLLILLAEELAKNFDINEIIIQSAENNGWSKIKSGDRGKERYDKSAESLGYKRKSQDKNWYKILDTKEEEQMTSRTSWTQYIPFWSYVKGLKFVNSRSTTQ